MKDSTKAKIFNIVVIVVMFGVCVVIGYNLDRIFNLR